MTEKFYAVTDSFHGTDADCSCETVQSVWRDKDIALAVAAATYQGGVEEYEFEKQEVVPKYAERHYDAIKRLRRKNKEVNTASIRKALGEK